MLGRVLNYGSFGLLLGAVLIAGCARISYQPEPLWRDAGWENYTQRSLEDESLRAFLADAGRPSEVWPRPVWDFEHLTLAMLHFNPELEVSRARWRLQLAEGVLANQRPGPRVDVQLEHHSEPREGDRNLSAWSAGFVFELLIERPAKRHARQEQWDAMAAAARLDVEAKAWQLRSDLRRQLLARYDDQRRLVLLAKQQALLAEAVELLSRREQLGQAGSFEVGTMRLEHAQQSLAMAKTQVQLITTHNDIARIIGIAPETFDETVIDWQGVNALPSPERLDGMALQRDALLNRHDLGKALEDYAAEEAAVKLAIESQYPDVTLSPGYFFDQGDNIWLVGIGWLSMLFHDRRPAIDTALARRHLAAARFRALQANIVAQVAAAIATYSGRYGLIGEASKLVDAQKTRRNLVVRELELGYADRLDAVRAELALMDAKIALHDATIAAIRAYGGVEDSIQRPIHSALVASKTNDSSNLRADSGQ